MAGSWSKLYHDTVHSPAMLDAIAEAGGAALGLYLEALVYAGKHLTDGRLTAGQVGRMACHSPTAAAALIKSGLWVQGDDGSLQIAGYLDGPERQESAADIRQRREYWTTEQREIRQRKRAAQPRLVRPVAERPAGPSDHVAPGVPCATGWCDGLYHYTRDPHDTSVPRAERSSWACPQGPRASTKRTA